MTDEAGCIFDGEPHIGERHHRGEQQCGERQDKDVLAGPRTKQEAKRAGPAG
jgi:hypothetical protein